MPIGHDGWALSPAGLPGIPPGVGRDSSSQEIVPIQGPDLTNITSQPLVVAREINTGLTGSFSPTTNANGIPFLVHFMNQNVMFKFNVDDEHIKHTLNPI
jgi:hypothetical protein